jgi:hypothetical protein
MTDDIDPQKEIEKFRAKRRRIVRKIIEFLRNIFKIFDFIGTVRIR